MKSYVTVTASGNDKPGIVNKISQVITKYDGNIEMQKAASMASDFAIIMSVAMNAAKKDNIDHLITELKALSDRDLFVYAKKAASSSIVLPPGSAWGKFSASGKDKAGIQAKITSLFVANEISIVSMEQNIKPDKRTNESYFSMSGKVTVPKSIDMDKFNEGLGKIEKEMNITITFHSGIED